jgi:hypothetical protein
MPLNGPRLVHVHLVIDQTPQFALFLSDSGFEQLLHVVSPVRRLPKRSTADNHDSHKQHDGDNVLRRHDVRGSARRVVDFTARAGDRVPRRARRADAAQSVRCQCPVRKPVDVQDPQSAHQSWRMQGQPHAAKFAFEVTRRTLKEHSTTTTYSL